MKSERIRLSTLSLALALALPGIPVSAIAAGEDYADKSTMDKAGDAISDSVLSTKVKTALLAQDGVDALKISVESEQGVVRLSGTLQTDAEVELAATTVEQVDGVKGIDNDLESVD